MSLENWIKKSGIIGNSYDDSIVGFAADLDGGHTLAYLAGCYQVYNNVASYALQIQISDNGTSWDDSSADPLNLTSEDETGFAIVFNRTKRYARASLNVVDGPGEILLGCVFLTAPVAGSTDVAPIDLTYDPEATFTTEQTITIPRGSGLPIRFRPATPMAIVAGSNWEARIGIPGISYVSYTVANSKLTVDTVTGEIIANPTATENALLRTDKNTYVELWRIGSGDDNKTVTARAKVDVTPTLFS